MIVGGSTWYRDLRWIVVTSLVAILAVVAYALEWSDLGRLPGGSSRTGFVCGVAGGLIIVFELLLWPRRRVRAWRVGSAQAWLRAHVWLGLLAVPLVVLHSRLLFIGGWLNVALVVLFFVVVASGVWGLVLQQFLPRMLLEQVPAETIREQIDHVAAVQCRDLDRLVRARCETGGLHEPGPESHEQGAHVTGDADDAAEEGDHAVVTGYRTLTGIQGRVLESVPIYDRIPGTAALSRRFFTEIRPYLLRGAAGGSPLASPVDARRILAGLREIAPTEAGDLVERIVAACDTRRQFDLQARLHGWLHGWLLVHVPLSFALGILLAAHVPLALWYW